MADDLPMLNLSNAKHRRVLVDYIKGLSGIWRFEFTKVRSQRSLNQNAYMHGVCFPLIARGLSAVRGGEPVTMLEAKDEMKDRFLRCEKVDKQTGEVVAHYTKSTHMLNVGECVEFIENMIKFAQDELGTTIPPSEDYREENDKPSRFIQGLAKVSEALHGSARP